MTRFRLGIRENQFAGNEAPFPAAKSQKKIGRNELKIPLLGSPVTVFRDLVSGYCKDRPHTQEISSFFYVNRIK
jgi:hypothetical protein